MPCDNTGDCPCSATSCDRYAKCCECLAHHRANGNLPICFFSDGHRETGRSKTIEDLYHDYIAHK